MEVQNASTGQTTVSWTATTQFSKTVTEAVSSLAVGDCVSVTGTASKKSKTTIAARTITVTTPTSSGSCSGIRRPRRSGAAGGAPGGPVASRFRRGAAGGAARARAAGTGPVRASPGGGSGASNFRKQLASLSVVTGKVTAVQRVDGDCLGYHPVAGELHQARIEELEEPSKTKKPATPKTEKLTITTSSSTTVSATQSAASSDLAVGDCVSAFGSAATQRRGHCHHRADHLDRRLAPAPQAASAASAAVAASPAVRVARAAGGSGA